MANSVVYFIQQAGGGPIKIGVTTDVRNRLSGLRTGAPAPLSLLATMPGDANTESELHRRFAEHRLHGEWFTPVGPMLDLIRSLQPPPSPPKPPRPLRPMRESKRVREPRTRAENGPERLFAAASLRAALERQGVSRIRLAEIFGIDEKHVRDMISGHKPIPVHQVLRMPSAVRTDFLQSIGAGDPDVALDRLDEEAK